MNIEEAQKNWESLASDDPLYIVLTYKDKKGKKWDPKDFFTTGEKEIAEAIAYIKSKNLSLKTQNALDFGCGVGRLTQALATRFDHVTGVDISATMITLAEKFNQFGDKCAYIVNVQNNLCILKSSSFDFIYTRITLQHIRPDYSKNYIKEFLRLLKPGGVLIFQITAEPIEPKTTGVKGFIKRLLPQWLLHIYKKIRYERGARIPMFGIKKDEVLELLRENGARVIDVRNDDIAGAAWTGYQYLITKE